MDWMMELTYIARMLMAAICGIAIGFERKNRSKEAGIRTHCIVACAAALMMLVSKYAYADIVGGNVKLDPSRVASTIVTGVSFIGAGAIFVQKQMIRGLTTAAGLWATAGIGMAVGGGMYIVGAAGTVIILAAQMLLHIDVKWFNAPKTKTLSVKGIEEENYDRMLSEKFGEMKISSHLVSTTKNSDEGTYDYEFLLEVPYSLEDDDIISEIKYDCTIKTTV